MKRKPRDDFWLRGQLGISVPDPVLQPQLFGEIGSLDRTGSIFCRKFVRNLNRGAPIFFLTQDLDGEEARTNRLSERFPRRLPRYQSTQGILRVEARRNTSSARELSGLEKDWNRSPLLSAGDPCPAPARELPDSRRIPDSQKPRNTVRLTYQPQ